MRDWSFLDITDNLRGSESAIRIRFQTISDIYRAMQTRLDGYRQSAGAIFLATFAASLTFDAVFIKLCLDESTVTFAKAHLDIFRVVVGASGAILIVGSVLSWWIIQNIGAHFAEMTSIVYKIDEVNCVFEPDEWLRGAAFYPKRFKIDKAKEGIRNVSRTRGEMLFGWLDPAISLFEKITIGLTVLHILFYSYLCFYYPLQAAK